MTEAERARLLEELKQQERQVYDSEGVRWVKCRYCGQVLPANECLTYGGIGTVNLGECRSCGPVMPEKKRLKNDEYAKLKRMRDAAVEMTEKINDNRELWNIYGNVRFSRLIRELDERLEDLKNKEFYTLDAEEMRDIEEMFGEFGL